MSKPITKKFMIEESTCIDIIQKQVVSDDDNDDTSLVNKSKIDKDIISDESKLKSDSYHELINNIENHVFTQIISNSRLNNEHWLEWGNMLQIHLTNYINSLNIDETSKTIFLESVDSINQRYLCKTPNEKFKTFSHNNLVTLLQNRNNNEMRFLYILKLYKDLKKHKLEDKDDPKVDPDILEEFSPSNIEKRLHEDNFNNYIHCTLSNDDE